MSSHREAPSISQDPAADSTDVYAFVSPDAPSTVTIIANYIPQQDPAAGPNFFEFGATSSTTPGGNGPYAAGGSGPVQYDININNDGTGNPNITYRFTFNTEILNPNTFLYATGPISNNSSGNGYSSTWNRPQTYTITKIVNGVPTPIAPANAQTLYCPPCNVGPRTTPNYPSLSNAAIYTLITGEKVFAGQRADAFWVDLGSVFDLGDLRPLSGAHLIPGAASNGINSLGDKNVHSIAIQIPISSLTKNGRMPSGPSDPNAVIGVWTAASRQTMQMINSDGSKTFSGPFQQISRLANPLVNEVVVPMASKDFWNTQPPAMDSRFAGPVVQPELAKLLPVLYPGAFPNLKAYTKDRADLVAIFATGIPAGVVPGFAGNYQSNTIAELLRLNMAIAPTNGTSSFSPLGLIGGDVAGFPNGRRPTDDVVTIELQAVAGATIPLVDPSYTVDAVVKSPGLDEKAPFNTNAVQATFPYLADPFGGFSNPTGTPGSNHSGSTNFTPTS